MRFVVPGKANVQPTQWPGNSVSVPSTQDERFVLLQSVSVFYEKHSDPEVPKQGITAEACDGLFEQLKTARAALTPDEADAEAKNNALELAEQQLRQKMGDLIVELGRLIPGHDPRWLRFGLNMPDAPEVPDVPENVVVNNSLPGKLLVTCDAATGASYYRFWKQVPEADAEFAQPRHDHGALGQGTQVGGIGVTAVDRVDQRAGVAPRGGVNLRASGHWRSRGSSLPAGR